MGKHKERNTDFEYDEDAAQALFGDVDLDDDAFYDQFEGKKSRHKARRDRNARRRIEEYWEDRDLAKRLHEFYDDE